MNPQAENNFFNLVNLIALALGYENLMENRSQSAYNDVHAANDKQAEYLLQQINARFDEQNKILERQNQILERLLELLEEQDNG